MDGPSAKKSNSLEKLVIQNTTNVNELKEKLNFIIKTGRDYEFDVSSCLQTLIKSGDQEIVLLTTQAIAELSKCESKRQYYATQELVDPILNILNKPVTNDNYDLIKSLCRVLGNLCYECDKGRKAIMQCNGVPVILTLLKTTLDTKSDKMEELKLIVLKGLLNYIIGGSEMVNSVLEKGLINIVHEMLLIELCKEDMSDSVVSTNIQILCVICDNVPEHVLSSEVNTAVLNVLKETSNIDISELCLDLLHMQAEHDSVKTLLAKKCGVQLVCSRLELMVTKHVVSGMTADDIDVENVMKQACDLIIIVLTGDEAMRLLYDNGKGDVYRMMVRWLESENLNLLATAVVAIGNFARQDNYCMQMMDNGIYDKLLDLFEKYHQVSLSLQEDPTKSSIEEATATKLEHAILSAVRNLLVPSTNKKVAADNGRAAPLFLQALPEVKEHHVAYKLMAALRMMVNGQESVAQLMSSSVEALSAAAEWGQRVQYAGAAGEAPRLIAACITRTPTLTPLSVEGCITCLVNMLVSSHSLMQNEAILALTLLSNQALKTKNEQDEKNLVTQLLKSEIGKHISVLMDTNCAKIPVEVAENIIAFLEITTKIDDLKSDYKEAKVDEIFTKFLETRQDLSETMKERIKDIVSAIESVSVS